MERAAEDYLALAGAMGAAAGPASSAPNVIGDLFGGAASRVVIVTTVPHAFHVFGFPLANNPNAFAFERDGVGTPDGFFSSGPGQDTNGDTFVDTFAMTEPLPPNEVPTSPGPTFVFDGGTVVFTDSTASTTPPQQTVPPDDGQIWFANYSYSETVVVEVPAGGGAVLRRIKIAENNSPLPRCRVYWDFNFYNDVNFGFGDVRQHTLGAEWAVLNGCMSFDVRLPLASTLASGQNVDGAQVTDTEFGNLSLIWKTLLARCDHGVVAAGLGVAVPTGEDTNLYRGDGRHVLQVSNEAIHLLPYLAGLWTPNEKWFLQGFLQADIDTNGNTVIGNSQGTALRQLGRLHDATLLLLDGVVGCWLYRDPCARLLTGVAPVAELHYTTTLEDTESISGAGLTVTSASRRLDILNLTLGTHVLLGEHLTVTPALAVPLRDGDDEQFDYEASVQANWLY
jgi:hypothetical protein